VKDILPDFKRQAFGFTTYLLRGCLFRNNSFDIIDPTGNIVFLAKPPAIISSGKSIFSSQGDELIACQNTCSFKDTYFSGVFRYEFKDILTSQIIGGLKGISNKRNPEGVEWQILDSQEMPIGYVTEDSSAPEVTVFFSLRPAGVYLIRADIMCET